ncbi:MAG: RNA polymerase sigma factor [Lacipirellulaceae bacterium]
MASTSESTIARYTEADPDVRLMLRVRDDDADAFRQLVERHQDRLTSILAYQTGRPDLAEDLAQDVFLRVYRARKRYQPGSKFTTWLFTIAGNVGLNALRTLARRKEVRLAPRVEDSGSQPIVGVAEPTAASAAMPTRQADSAELRDAVRAAVAGLGERQRLAVMLAKFEHLGYAEIGEVMGMTALAVKSLLARARENLRDALQPYLDRGQHVAGLTGAQAFELGDDMAATRAFDSSSFDRTSSDGATFEGDEP